jgi:hypothetical protein
MDDTKDWNTERESKEFRRNPCEYRDSHTARRRAKYGPTEDKTRTSQASRATMPDPSQNRPIPTNSSVQPSYGQVGYQQTQYATYSPSPTPQNVQPNYYQATGSQPPASINIQVSAGAAAGGMGTPSQGQHGTASFATGDYSSQPQQSSGFQYQQTSQLLGPQNPSSGGSQPGGGTFDRYGKPITSRAQGNQGNQDRRPSTYDQDRMR